MPNKILIILLLVLSFHAKARSVEDNQQLILNRYRLHLMQLPMPIADSIAVWTATQNENGQWPDIAYQSKDPAAWPALNHLDRVREMAIFWFKGNSNNQKDKVWACIDKGINHWLSSKYQSGNWWFNEIGVPQRIRDIIVLTNGKLTANQLQGLKAVLGQFKLRGVGANLIWSADLAIHAGALNNDTKLIATACELLAKEIKISTEEGIQPDFSYHQHQARLQIYHYGNSYLKDNVRIAWQLKGTPWALEQQKINILSDFVIEGWRWMARGIYTVPATVDRAATRAAYLKNAGLGIYLSYLIELLPEKQKVFEEILKAQQHNQNLVTGYKYFPYSDFSAYHQAEFSFFLKTLSSRTEATEKINGENRKGDFLNFGNSYFVRNGKEYTDMMPVWDWKKLPGTTNFEGATKIERQNFVGGLSSGKTGFSVMQLASSNATQSLLAQKLWANYKNVMICLIADITLSSPGGKVFTVLDQARVQGPIVVDNPKNTITNGQYKYKKLGWIFHAGLSYIPIGATSIELLADTVNGSWKDVNNSGSDKRVLETVFMPSLIHRNKSDAAYAVALTGSVSETQKLVAHPNWRVLSNTKSCQAIAFDQKVLMLAFREAGAYKLGKRTISINRPCLVLIEQEQIFLADPLFTGGELQIKIDTKPYLINLPKNGTRIELTQ
ncbi:MAG: polysaccharide lyase family 8 super-sandwich domain-containing protein [Bacteroidota bacterium]